MLTAVLADIHGNLEAFQAVIENLEQHDVERVFCLGDLIGYGPDPEAVVQLFQDKGYWSVLGNHEAALQNITMRNWLNFQAKQNSIQTEKLLSRQSLTFCCSLAENLTYENAIFVHGFPPASVLRYVTMSSDTDFMDYFSANAAPLCFVGHTHELIQISWDGHHLKKEILEPGRHQLKKGQKHIINGGSVGQPRDGTNSAKYLLWETKKNSLEVKCVDYDIETTFKKIKERGFPEAYGIRLR